MIKKKLTKKIIKRRESIAPPSKSLLDISWRPILRCGAGLVKGYNLTVM